MKIVLWCLSLAILFHPGKLTDGKLIDESAQSFRVIPIPTRENGYSNFESIAFMSRAAMDSFLTDTSAQLGWNNRQLFEDALLNARVDFSKEALVLLRHTEGSGSVQVTFGTPALQDRNLVCEIQGRPIPPGYGGTADMAYYCFAVVVSKAQVSQVELQAFQGLSERRLAPIVLPITEKEPANKPLPPPVKQTQIQDCPRISVSCPDEVRVGNAPIRFQASATGAKPGSEISYNWSVSKGTISRGQGTAVIEVEVTGTDLEGLTATVEVNGFDPNCARVASCSVAIP